MVQTSAIATGVAIIGMTKIVRSAPRQGNWRWKTIAAGTPSTIGMTTASSVNQSVRGTDSRNRSSVVSFR